MGGSEDTRERGGWGSKIELASDWKYTQATKSWIELEVFEIVSSVSENVFVLVLRREMKTCLSMKHTYFSGNITKKQICRRVGRKECSTTMDTARVSSDFVAELIDKLD